MTDGERTLLIDASTFIPLAEIDSSELLYRTRGRIVVPDAVQREITDEPAKSELDRAVRADEVIVLDPFGRQTTDPAATSVQANTSTSPSRSLERSDTIVVTDDKPFRETCKALSVPVSDSIGILVRAVDRGDVTAVEAKDALLAMDEVGVRPSARLLRHAERLIEDAATER